MICPSAFVSTFIGVSERTSQRHAGFALSGKSRGSGGTPEGSAGSRTLRLPGRKVPLIAFNFVGSGARPVFNLSLPSSGGDATNLRRGVFVWSHQKLIPHTHPSSWFPSDLLARRLLAVTSVTQRLAALLAERGVEVARGEQHDVIDGDSGTLALDAERMATKEPATEAAPACGVVQVPGLLSPLDLTGSATRGTLRLASGDEDPATAGAGTRSSHRSRVRIKRNKRSISALTSHLSLLSQPRSRLTAPLHRLVGSWCRPPCRPERADREPSRSPPPACDA